MTANSRILLVDDNTDARVLLRRVLETEGYAVEEARDGVEALEIVRARPPHLVISDMVMPLMDGLELCQRLKGDPETRLIPVIILTGMGQVPDRLRALELEADDYLTKPCSLPELRARVRALLKLKHTLDEMENAAAVLHAVAAIVERRDAYTSTHCRDVATLCASLAARMGLPDESIGRLRMAAAFHDIGKIAVDDAVLRKPGPLTPDERALMQRHAADGADLLKPMNTLRELVPLVRHHHERLDGSGYPDGLSGDEISLEMRILSVVDIYQALVMKRPYKDAMTPAAALAILRQEVAKGWWDGKVVEVLATLVAAPPPA